MPLLIAGVALFVIYLAIKSPDMNSKQTTLPPNSDVPMLGSVGNISPAMGNGAPALSKPFRTAMTVNAGLVGGQRQPYGSQPSPVLGQNQLFQQVTQTVAEMSKTLMTQAPAALPTSKIQPVKVGPTLKL